MFLAVLYTKYQTTYEKYLLLVRLHLPLGTVLPHWHAMNGSAGQPLSGSWKQEKIMFKECMMRFWKESEDLVAG